jgi:quinol-cytochrome oxidoreductase complex cytochrome b subunit
MLIYTGRGWVVLVLFFAVLIGGLVFFKDFKQDHPVYRSPWPEVICASINIVGCAGLGWWLNSGRPRRVFEFDLSAPSSHSFCFVRVGYCGVFAALLYGYLLYQAGAFR